MWSRLQSIASPHGRRADETCGQRIHDSITADELGLAFEQVEVEAASALVGQELRATRFGPNWTWSSSASGDRMAKMLFIRPATRNRKRHILIAIGRCDSLLKLMAWRAASDISSFKVSSFKLTNVPGNLRRRLKMNLETWNLKLESLSHWRSGYLGTPCAAFSCEDLSRRNRIWTCSVRLDATRVGSMKSSFIWPRTPAESG